MKKLHEVLQEHREKKGYEYAYDVYKEWGILRDNLINIERGIAIPRKLELIALSYIYGLSKKQFKELLELREQARKENENKTENKA